MTVLVTSHEPCPGERGSDIKARVQADRHYATRRLGKRLRAFKGTKGVPAGDALGAALRRAATQCTRTPSTCPWARGLVILYSGHGVASSESKGGVPKSKLCVDEQLLDVEKLAKHIESLSSPPPWLVLVLNACESAFVDISRRTLPTAVLSASPSPIAVHLPPPGEDSERPPNETGKPLSPTPFMQGAVDALAGGEADSDQNGIVSTREVLRQIRSAVNDAGGGAAPRLQLQSPADLPVAFVPWSGKRESQLRALLEDVEGAGEAELGCALRRQLCLARPELSRQLCRTRCGDESVLPSLAWDSVRMADSHQARCLATTERPTKDRDCPALPNFHLAPPELSLQALRELARISLFHEVYDIASVGEWVDVRRMRDGRLMATTRAPFALDAVPRRWAVFGHEARPRRYRVMGVIAKGTATQGQELPDAAFESRRFAACEEIEGQCFVTAPSSQP